MKNRKIYIGICSFICVICLALSAAFAIGEPQARVKAKDFNLRDLPYYMSSMNYSSASNSSSGSATANANAVNGGDITLGWQAQMKIYNSGLSLITYNEDQAAFAEIILSEVHDYVTFAVDYGIDGAQANQSKNAIVKILIDGVEVSSEKVKSNFAQKVFSTDVKGKRVVRLEAYGAEGACVSFGDASFYTDGVSAAGKVITNIKCGAWPAPVSRNYNLYGGSMVIGGEQMDYGFCFNSVGSFDLIIGGQYNFLQSYVGIDDAVAGGENSGSATITATVYDKDDKILSTMQTPVLYGYMSAYKLCINVKGGYKVNFLIGDGGDGIANDMTVIGNPVLSNTLDGGKIYLSDTALEGEVGSGTLGIDKHTDNSVFNYTVNSTTIKYNKGVGLYLKNANYEEYIKDKTDYTKFTYVRTDIEGLGYKFFETTIADANSQGAYYEIWVDGKCIASTGVLNSFARDKSASPYRFAAKLPEDGKTFELRAISENGNRNGNVALGNAAFYSGDEYITNMYAESEVKSSDGNYSFTRGVDKKGDYVKMYKNGELRSVGDCLVSGVGAQYTFDISNSSGDTFTAVVGLTSGYSGDGVTFKGVFTYKDGSTLDCASPIITKQNSGYTVQFYYGNDVETITLVTETDGSGKGEIVWANPKIFKTSLNDVEYLTDMTFDDWATGWGNVGINKNVVGGDLIINNKRYDNGICLHAFADYEKNAYVEVSFPASFGYTVFETWVGVNKDTQNNGTNGSVIFMIEGDGKLLYKSNLMRAAQDAEHVILDIRGISSLKLLANNGDKSYDCDWADFIAPKIARSTDYLEECIDIYSPTDKQSIVLEGEQNFTVSGRAVGTNNDVKIYLNGQLENTVKADVLGNFSGQIKIKNSGENVITVSCGNTTKDVSVNVCKPILNAEQLTISTLSTRLTVKPAANGMVITSLKDKNDYEWIKGESFIPFIPKVKLGGRDGQWHYFDWIYVEQTYHEEVTMSENINSEKQTYIGKTMYWTFDYTDKTGMFDLHSIWYTQSDFASPITHEIQIENKSGQKVYVLNADTLVTNLSKSSGATVTNSYAYKSAMYTTNYGYRVDEVKNGYDMNVFCSTDYNNGMQIDAGYIPWVSLNQKSGSRQNGVYMGVMWSDCRIQVQGVEDGVYVEAGLDEDFFTEIPEDNNYNVPASFIGAYTGDVDDGSIEMKKWYYTFIMAECNRIDLNLPSFEYNLWEVLDSERRSWRMSDEKFYDAVYDFAKIGVQEICIDTYWWKQVGDWRGVHEKWQSSMEYSSNFVNALGMYFSLYMQAGNGLSDHSDALTSNGVNGNPNWFARGEGLSWDEVCLADPDAFEYLVSYLKNYYMEFGLDGMRTDFGYIIGYCIKEGHQHIDKRADVGYWTSTNMYKLLEEMYKLFPVPTDVLNSSEAHYFKWEDCNCGGTLKDFKSMSYATRIQTTDAFSSSEVRRSFYDASYCYPSMQLMLWLNDYMYDPTGPIPDDQYRFWSLLMGAGCPMMSMISDMPDITSKTLKRTIEIYNDWMKFLVRYGNVYHIMDRYDGINWDGIEYYEELSTKGAVLAFKPDPDGSADDTYKVKFKGVVDDLTYYVWSENGNIPFATYTGAQLKQGLSLTLEGSYKAEIIYFISTEAKDAKQITEKPGEFVLSADCTLGKLEIGIGAQNPADYYLINICSGDEVVYSFITQNRAGCSVIRGLDEGEYRVEAVAYNRFGSRSITETVQITNPDFVCDNTYTVVGEYSTDEIVINDERYTNGYSVDLSDKTFGVSTSKSLEITNITGNKFTAKIALPFEDDGEVLNVKIVAIAPDGESEVGNYMLNSLQNVMDLDIDLPEGCFKLRIDIENLTKDIYLQRNYGYGRMGLYSNQSFKDNEFTFTLDVERNGLNETFPRAGAFAAYVDDDCFAAVYIDAYYSNIVFYERTSGISSDRISKIKMPEGFDYKARHTIKCIRTGSQIEYYIDGTYLTTRSFISSAAKVALITEDAEARFGEVKLAVDGSEKNLSWTQKECDVRINGAKIYGSNSKKGIWLRPQPEFVLVIEK